MGEGSVETHRPAIDLTAKTKQRVHFGFFYFILFLTVEGEGYIGFFWKCFFHCGEGREGKGVIFFTNSLWDGERVHRGKGSTEGKGAP
jgi:hypothetical protein